MKLKIICSMSTMICGTVLILNSVFREQEGGIHWFWFPGLVGGAIVAVGLWMLQDSMDKN